MDVDMTRQIGLQFFGYTDRPHAGTATAMRNGKSLVQIQVTDVGADQSRAGESNLSVHIGSVHIDQTAIIMDSLADILNAFFENSVSRGISDHQTGQRFFV